ncbi:baeRF2 domain-containing protein [Nesterenkonia suensis]
MQLTPLKHLFDRSAPFSTVYLEARSPAEDAEHQLRLRWDELRSRLDDDGAPAASLEALDGAIIGDGTELTQVHREGRVLVADADAVLLDEPWDAALGQGDSARLDQYPALGDYVRERTRSAVLLVAVADQEGATLRRVRVAEGLELAPEAEKEAEGAGEGSVHKPREGALSHRQIQRRADEVVTQNARSVAEHMERLASRWRPDAVVLAGEIQGRTTLAEELPASLEEITHIAERGGIGDEAAEEALSEDLRLVTRRLAAGRSQDHTSRSEQARAENRVAEGTEAVRLAAQMGGVETLLLQAERSGRDEDEVIASAARLDAEIAVTPTELPDGVAAILHFEAPEEVARA